MAGREGKEIIIILISMFLVACDQLRGKRSQQLRSWLVAASLCRITNHAYLLDTHIYIYCLCLPAISRYSNIWPRKGESAICKAKSGRSFGISKDEAHN